MNVLIIVGSNRVESETGRLGTILEERFLSKHFGQSKTHNLARLRIPLWDEGVWHGSEEWKRVLDPILEDLQEADAYVIMSPEWSGMATPMLKNYLLFGDHRSMGHKPSLLVGVSSGTGGALPVQELRASSYKNTRICHIPEHLVIRNAGAVLTGEDPEGDEKMSSRMAFCSRLLAEYAIALKSVRAAEVDWDRYPYGM